MCTTDKYPYCFWKTCYEEPVFCGSSYVILYSSLGKTWVGAVLLTYAI